jgi:hypothetical protein
MTLEVTVNGAGPNSNIEAQVDGTFSALRASLKPTEYTSNLGVLGGHYKIASNNGASVMAAGIASGAQVFQVRWADPSKLFILERLTVQCSTATGFAATAQGCPLDLIIGHGSTANGSGGSALSVSSISNKMRNVMGSSAFVTSGEIRIASTAALTAATGQTLEPNPIGMCAGAPNATLVQSPPMDLFALIGAGDHPLILATGDTLAIRANNPAATGTWFLNVSMTWLEAVAY